MSRTVRNLLALLVGFLLAVFAGLASADNLVCAALDTDGITCIEWLSQQPFGLPPLTSDEVKELTLAAWLFWATCFVWRELEKAT